MIKKYFLFVMFFSSCFVTLSSSQAPSTEQVSRAEFDAWFDEISNWGRWGDDDELGTLNLITPEKILAATKLVTEGISVSMSFDLNTKEELNNGNPFQHALYTIAFNGHQVAGDTYSVRYHGYAHSHMDGLPHFAHKGKLYNGFPFDILKPDGAEKLGIENAHNGVITRGVIVDMPAFKGIDYLEAGTAITIEDLEAWEKFSGVTVSSGDVLLIRTGRWEQERQKGTWNFVGNAAGLHASVAKWLKARDVAIIGSDGISDVVPSGVEGVFNPLHELVLAGLGMPMLDNLDLDAVAREAKNQNRSTFLFIGAPLRVKGGTGSPMNPLAVF